MDKVDNKSELFKLLFVRQRGILDAPLPAAVSFPIIAIRNGPDVGASIARPPEIGPDFGISHRFVA